MQTFLLIWAVSSMALIAVALILRSDGLRSDGEGRHALGRLAILAGFWPLILTGLFISFLVWYVRRSIGAHPAQGVAP